MNIFLFQNCADQSNLKLSQKQVSSSTTQGSAGAPSGGTNPNPSPAPAPNPNPVVVSASNQQLLTKLLKFAQTWKRNWNFEGHSVDNRFTASTGFWDYTETTYEPWLFDRASVGYKLYLITNDTQWLTQAESDFNWYVTRIDADGIFTPKRNTNPSDKDTKYGYTTPFVHRGNNNLTQAHLSAAQRIYDSWIESQPNIISVTATSMWTEREVGLALEAAVGYYELTSNSAALIRAQALVDQWQTFADRNNGAPLVTYTRHEGGGPGGTTPQDLVTSPWMSALYFQAARRYIAAQPSARTQVYNQASLYFDWLEAHGGFYDASVVGAEYTGFVFPAYLAGLWLNGPVGDGGPDEGNMSHALDVAGMIAFAIVAKQNLGLPTDRAVLRLAQMRATADRDFDNWTRTTTYLPKYRLVPPRKFNWQLRGMWELIALTQ